MQELTRDQGQTIRIGDFPVESSRIRSAIVDYGSEPAGDSPLTASFQSLVVARTELPLAAADVFAWPTSGGVNPSNSAQGIGPHISGVSLGRFDGLRYAQLFLSRSTILCWGEFMNIACIRPQGFPGVDDYFRHFPVAHSGSRLGGAFPFTVGFLYIDRELSLQGVLYDAFLKCQQGDALVIVGHGTPEKLSIPIGVGSSVGITVTALQALNDAADSATPDLNAVARACGMRDTSTVGLILDYVAAVRKLQLSHVAIRACNVGQNFSWLVEMQQLFGCKCVSAPKRRDFFASTKVKYMSTVEFDKFEKKYPGNFYFGKAPHRISIVHSIAKGSTSGTLGFKAESEEAVRQFMRAKFRFVSPFEYKRGDQIALHGLWNDGIYPYFFFPADSGYSANLNSFVDPWALLPNLPPPTDEYRGGLRGAFDRVRSRIQTRRQRV